jgi:hypothetical protein
MLKITALAAFVTVTAIAQTQNGGSTNGGTVSVPDAGSSVILLGIAATGCILFARNRIKR